MREQSNKSSQVFHMSLTEPLILAVLIPIVGIFLSAWLLITKPTYFEVWVPIVVLILCVLAIFQGMMMPTKVEFQGREIVISYLARKRIVNLSDITKYFLNEEKAGRGAVSGTRSFITLQLNAGRKISFKNIKDDNDSLLEALEKWTGLQPAERKDLKVIMEQHKVESERQKQIPQNRPDLPLSIQAEQLIQKMFHPNEHDEVRQRLIKFGNDFYPDFYDKNKLDDLQLSALKKSKGNIKKLNENLSWLSPR